jgi:hypothetical protein
MIVSAGAPRLATLIATGCLLTACGDIASRAWSAATPAAAGRDRDAQSADAVLPRCDIASATTGPLPEPVRETSGLAPGRRHPQVTWTHNDAGNAVELHALDAHACRTDRSTGRPAQPQQDQRHLRRRVDRRAVIPPASAPAYRAPPPPWRRQPPEPVGPRAPTHLNRHRHQG